MVKIGAEIQKAMTSMSWHNSMVVCGGDGLSLGSILAFLRSFGESLFRGFCSSGSPSGISSGCF